MDQKQKHLVLVLGAGASYPYGFPLGRRLVFDIVQELQSSGSTLSVLLQLGYQRSDLNQFADALHRSNLPSIDSFLESRSALQELGKLAIAASLIPREDPRKLIRESGLQWYEFLFSKLFTREAEEFPKKRISVITFNYDRSFEAALLSCIQHAYGIVPTAAIEIAKRIEVVHMYGQLGNFFPEATAGVRPYSTEVSPVVVRDAAMGIRVISEGRKDTPEMKRARELIDTASEVVFLGFGFHPDNVERLGFPREGQRLRVYATSIGMTETETNDASVSFPSQHWRIQFFPKDADCLMGLRLLTWL